MKTYETIAAFWRKGNLVSVGTRLQLSDVEVRYLHDAVTEVAGAAETVQPAVVEVAPVREIGAKVVEQAEDKPAPATAPVPTPDPAPVVTEAEDDGR